MNCVHCGYPKKEHSYNGACYGLCGEFMPIENDRRWHPDPVMHDMRMVGNIVGGVGIAVAAQQAAQTQAQLAMASYQTQVVAAQAAAVPVYAVQADVYALNAKIAALTMAVERLQAQLGQPVTV